MRFAVSVPQFYSDGEVDPTAFGAFLARAEELGFDSAWAQERIFGPAPQLGPLEAMTYAAACTRHLRIGCAVLVSTLHNPVHLAKSLSTLDQLSRGRIEVGFGTGGPARQFAAFGVDPGRYTARFAEGLSLMKALWTEPRVSFDGKFWHLAEAAMEPKSFQKPHPPIWLGGSGPVALRRAARLGTGFFGSGAAPTETFARQVLLVREELARSGRPVADFSIAKRVYIAVGENAGATRRRINAALERLYGRRSPDTEAAAIAGTVADCARDLRKVAAAGAELILCTPLFDQAEFSERLAAEIIPSLG